jgi:hypothetical protein
MPTIVRTRWLSLGEFIDYLLRHYRAVAIHVSNLSEPAHSTISAILGRYHFYFLGACFRVWNRLIQWTEGEDARLCVAFHKLLGFLEEFNQLLTEQNPYASACRAAFCQRLIQTADDGQVLLAFLVTEQRLS